MSKASALAKLYKQMLEMGIKPRNLSAEQRAAQEAIASAVGLPDAVFHATPHAFSRILPGSDNLIHVAEDPSVALTRLKDVNSIMSPESRIYNVSPKQAERLGIDLNPENFKGALLELQTKLGRPLEISDLGDFDLYNLASEKNIASKLDPDQARKLKRLGIEQRDLGKQYDAVDDASDITNEMREIGAEGVDILSKILREQGYDSLKYKNLAEIPENMKFLERDYLKNHAKITQIEDDITRLREKGERKHKTEIAELRKRQDEIKATNKFIESKLPESNALFPDTVVRERAADFDRKKLEDTNNLLASLGIATGAGLASSLLDSPEANAGIVSKLDDVAKGLDKARKASKGNISLKDIYRILEIPENPKSQKDVNEVYKAFNNALRFAIVDRVGAKLDDNLQSVRHKWLDTAHPYLKGKKDMIIGLDDPRGALQQEIEEQADLLRKENPKLTYTEAFEKAMKEHASAGYFDPNTLKIKNFDPDPTTVDHELMHYLDFIRDPAAFQDLNLAYSTKYPHRGSDLLKDPLGSMARIARANKKDPPNTNYRRIVTDLINKDALSLSPEGEIKVIDPTKFRQLLSKEIRTELPNDLQYYFGKHFTDYDVFEPQRAAEILSDRIKMPSRNPIENEIQIRRIKEGLYDDHDIGDQIVKMNKNIELEEVPAQFLDFKKRQYDLPRFQPEPKPKFLSNTEKARLQELEKKFGNMDSDDFGDL
jgi:hypothetical protein